MIYYQFLITLIASSIIAVKGKDIKHVLENAIKDGSSLEGKTVEDWRSRLTTISAVGSVENFSKWLLEFQEVEVESGKLVLSLRSVKPDQREAFSSRKTINVVAGSQVRFTFRIDDDIIAHIAYSISVFEMFKNNQLALALCSVENEVCRSLNSKDMFKKNYHFVDKKEFGGKINTPAKICYDNACLVGKMGPGFEPTVEVGFYPRSYLDIADGVKIELKKNNISLKEYDSYILSIFKK